MSRLTNGIDGNDNKAKFLFNTGLRITYARKAFLGERNRNPK